MDGLYIVLKLSMTQFPIEQALKEHWGGKKVVKIVVPTKDEWKGNPDHPYRKHASLGLSGIPTLVILQKDNQLLKLDDEEGLCNPDDIQEFLEAYQ